MPGGVGRPISISMVIVTSSPTTGPASTIELYFSPYSRRLIFVVAVVPVTMPFMPLVTGAGASTSSATSFVVPRIVRSPISLNAPPAPGSTRLDLNVMVGYLAVSKKSEPRRSLSRFAYSAC